MHCPVILRLKCKQQTKKKTGWFQPIANPPVVIRIVAFVSLDVDYVYTRHFAHSNRALISACKLFTEHFWPESVLLIIFTLCTHTHTQPHTRWRKRTQFKNGFAISLSTEENDEEEDDEDEQRADQAINPKRQIFKLICLVSRLSNVLLFAVAYNETNQRQRKQIFWLNG